MWHVSKDAFNTWSTWNQIFKAKHKHWPIVETQNDREGVRVFVLLVTSIGVWSVDGVESVGARGVEIRTCQATKLQ